jgi:FkbM family methyltransferase
LEFPVDQTLYRSVETRYGRLTVFANDTGAVTQSLMRYGEWAENEIRFLCSPVCEGDVVLDVGAYIGTHTLAFSRAVGASGRVISIEPQLATFALLKKNVEANSVDNVQLENAAASSEPGNLLIPSIHIEQPDSFGSASLLQAHLVESQGFGGASEPTSQDDVVRAITIDSIGVSHCALIKIDAEGMEESVLRGALLTLRRCTPIVYAECNSLYGGLKTLAVLNANGYRVLAHVVRAFNPDNYLGVSDNIFDAAREVALVGVAEAEVDRVRSIRLRPSELLLDIETADDLALALLNKPQYVPEILRPSAAARSGGVVCLDGADAIRFEAERLRNEAAALRQDAAAARGETAVVRQQAEAATHQAAAANRDAEAKLDACLRQVGLMRKDADRTKADNQRLEADAAAAKAALAAVYASTSWRLSAPVRKVVVLLRRFRRR